jgi:GntR family transcriptional regulator/MocR family aminotransferase
MPKQRLLLDWIVLDRRAPLPLFRQLYLQLRAATMSGRLPGGSLLPSSRMLSRELGVSRNTVLDAYDQLIGERYLETSEGSATTVVHLALHTAHPAATAGEAVDAAPMPVMSKRGLALQSSSGRHFDLPDVVAFAPGVPAFDEFPVKTWVRLLSLQAHRMQPDMADNDAHVGGYGPLREELSSYLRLSRMVACQSDQVFVVSSARAGLDLICRLIADPGTSCLMEEPGYNAAKNVMRAAGLEIVPVPVDAEGLRIDLGEGSAPEARLAFVTPSHQWPTGVSLSANRRQRLLDWAERRNAWVVEDDYDSEFRFDSPPLATLQGLDGGRRVFYTGTFSKVLFPSLRTAYVVVPRPLISAFRQAVYFAGQEPALHIQAALADFISEGHFSAHVRRMRRVYKRRQSIFVEALVRGLGSQIPVVRPPGGMQMSLILPKEYKAEEVSLSAAAAGLHARPLAIYASTDAAPNALHLGYAAIPDRRIEPATEALAAAILAVG